MTKVKAIIFVSVLAAISILVPSIVIYRSVNIRSGYKGLPWGKTQYQVEQWARSNNNKSVWSRCPSSHYGVNCIRLTWKQNQTTPFEYVEYQFKDEKLVAVIETQHEKPFDKDIFRIYGKSENGTDYARETYKEKGTKYELRDWINYYSPSQRWKGTKLRYAVNVLYRKNLSNPEQPEEKLMYQLTTGYYSPEYYEEARTHNENFPSHHFLSR